MHLSSREYYFFQLWLLEFLRTLLTSIIQLLRLATTTTATPPPLQREPEPDGPTDFKEPNNYKCYHNRKTSASKLPSKSPPHAPRIFYEHMLAPVNAPLPTLSLGGDQLDEAISPECANAPTQATLDLAPLQDGTPTWQDARAVLAWLIHVHLHSTLPPLNNEIVLPTPIARRLVWTAFPLAYTYPDLQKIEPQHDRSFTANSAASDLVQEMPDSLGRRSSTQPQPPSAVSQIPDASAFYETHFIPADPSLLGCIEEPKGKPLCAGGYSDVWQCNIRFSTPSEALPAKVAVKVLRSVWLSNRNEDDANERKLRRFKQEVITWLTLPKHPNIVPLIGWTLTPNLSFISPWYKQGNLYAHLKDLLNTQRIQILLGIAKGLECLHSRNPPVVHGDLKPENILMSDLGEALLADFGLSTILGEERMYTSSHRVGGSLAWMSPEQMVEGSRSCQSDVYSFGSLVFTVMTGSLPHAELNPGKITFKVCNTNDPEDLVEDWSKYPALQGPIKNLLKDCWSRSPDARPSMSAVVRRLTTLALWME